MANEIYKEEVPAVTRDMERRHRSTLRFTTQGGLLRIVFLCIMFVTVLRTLMGASSITFTGFLEMLSSTPLIPTDWLQNWNINVAGSLPDWLNWLGSFVDWFVSGFQMVMFLSVSIVNIFPFIAHFLFWFFTS